MHNPQCYITGLQKFQSEINLDNVESYQLIINNNHYHLNFSKYIEHWVGGEELEQLQLGTLKLNLDQARYTAIRPYQHILAGILYNDKWPLEKDKFLTLERIKKIVNDADYPRTPKEKKEYVFNSLFTRNNIDGQWIEIEGYSSPEVYNRYYFKKPNELSFYLENLYFDKLIVLEPEPVRAQYGRCKITYEGLNYGIQINEEGANSNLCFVAMSFDNDDLPIFTEAIKPACTECGFEARRVDLEHPEAEQTINDAMIVMMKKSKFCIADFTKQKSGVYFESGFCLGKGMKVIYTCQKEHFDNSHFDINHFQVIIYETIEELKNRLIDKIEAWIK